MLPLRRVNLNLDRLDHEANTAFSTAKEALNAVHSAKDVERVTEANAIDGSRFPAATHPPRKGSQ